MWFPKRRRDIYDQFRSGDFGAPDDLHPYYRISRFAKLPRVYRYSYYAIRDMMAIVVAGTLLAFVYFTISLQHPMKAAMAGGTPIIRILDKHGEVVSERGKRHAYMPIKLLPKHVIDAVVATEDRRFYRHWGVDPVGMFRAALANLRAAGYHQGGSTLTQQLAKNLYLSSERTLRRKFEEILLAFWLELRLTKSDILELYLNRVYFGAGAYGIESAAQRYFGKSARELSVPEAALLAGLLKAPSKYSPITSPGVARTRARVVLAQMQAIGAISAATAEAGRRQSLQFRKPARRRQHKGFEYVVDYVQERLPQLSGLKQAEVIVETTIDAKIQRHAYRSIAARLAAGGKRTKELQAAAIVLDMDGGIAALVGGRAYSKSQYNRATQAMRQPGSAFKPIVYLAALEAGLTPNKRINGLPISVGKWRPKNHNNSYDKRLTLRQALAKSSNTASVRVFRHTGAKRVHAVARRLGIRTPLHDQASLALGTAEVKLISLTAAYAHFANGGAAIRPHIIRRVRVTNGRILYARKSPRKGRVIKRRHVAAINSMLRSALRHGTGKRAHFAGHQIAGKTGTTQSFRDAWFVGYSAHLVAGIWLGNDNNQPTDRIVGGSVPAAIWRQIMQTAHRQRKARPLPTWRKPQWLRPRRKTVPKTSAPKPVPRLAGRSRAETRPAQSQRRRQSPSHVQNRGLSVEDLIASDRAAKSRSPGRFAPDHRMALGRGR